MRRFIPWCLVCLRLLLAPTIVWVAGNGSHPRSAFALILFAALASDIFDGVLARRWGCATPVLRLSDTVVDTVFYVCVTWAIVIRYPGIIHRNLILLLALLGMEVARFILEFIRFRKLASYHTYAAKVWGLLLIASSFSVLCLGRFPVLITLTIAWGILCDAEGLAISVVLREWTPDVKNLGKALQLRKTGRAGR